MGKVTQVIFVEYEYSYNFEHIAKDNIIDSDLEIWKVRYYVTDYDKALKAYKKAIVDRDKDRVTVNSIQTAYDTAESRGEYIGSRITVYNDFHKYIDQCIEAELVSQRFNDFTMIKRDIFRCKDGLALWQAYKDGIGVGFSEAWARRSRDMRNDNMDPDYVIYVLNKTKGLYNGDRPSRII